MYADGITPGNAFSPENKRKAIVFYGSFLDFGRFMSSEAAWLPVAVARTRSI